MDRVQNILVNFCLVLVLRRKLLGIGTNAIQLNNHISNIACVSVHDLTNLDLSCVLVRTCDMLKNFLTHGASFTSNTLEELQNKKIIAGKENGN